MNLTKLLPVVAVVGVLMAATAAIATTQGISSDHNYAAEGEQDARQCNGFEVEYGQNNGDVDRVKLHFAAQVGNVNDGECQDQWVNVEVHDALHNILGSCPTFQIPQNITSIDCNLTTPILHGDGDPTTGVEAIDHVNIVVTDLN